MFKNTSFQQYVSSKISSSAPVLAQHLRGLQEQGAVIVFTNGCYDIVHAGHASLLYGAKALGDVLVVGLNTDESIKRIKGNERPVCSYDSRSALLASLHCVDYVVPFEQDTPYELIKLLTPDILVKGGDYRHADIVGADIVKGAGGRVITLPLEDGLSTTSVIDKIRDSR